MYLFKGIFFMMFSLLSIGGCASKNVGTSHSISLSNSEDMLIVNSKELKSTIITPHMEEKIRNGQNHLYCSTFQLAWNEFRDSYDTHLPNEPEIIKLLDKKLATKEDISEDCYVARAGRPSEIVDKMNKALKAKFKNEAPTVKSEALFLIYTFLFKNLIFKKEFEKLEEPIHFKLDEEFVRVRAFGISFDKKKHRGLRKQVTILDYKDDSDFIIGLRSKSKKDKIVLAKIKPQGTLLETIKFVEERIKKAKPGHLKKDEPLKIPKMDFDIEHSYPEIEDRWCPNLETTQKLRFRLNEKGIILKSEARIVIYEGVKKIMHRRPRWFVFDKPFLIYLKEKDSKYPYFAMWVGNPELLVKAKE